MKKLLLFDLDGTLLTSDKCITTKSLKAINRCRKKGYSVGVCTSRGEASILNFLEKLKPEVMIANGGAVVKCNNKYIKIANFSNKRTREIIQIMRDVCGSDIEITIDTIDAFYWNYKEYPEGYQSFGEIIQDDLINFKSEGLKICGEIKNRDKEKKVRELLTDCAFERFRDSNWCKFTLKDVSKENAIELMSEYMDIKYEDIIAFGDDIADIKMLEMSGLGIAMGNAVDKVKEVADIVIKGNDEEGIAEYLETLV